MTVDLGHQVRALARTVYGALTRRPALRELIGSLPLPLRFLDGRTRVVPLRLARLAWVWRTLPSAHAESVDAYAAYDGGDVLDVGAFHGWYSLLLAPKARPGDRFVSFEPDARAQPVLLGTLSGVASVFPELVIWSLPAAVGDGAGAVVSFPMGEEGHPRVLSGEADGAGTLSIDAFVHQARLRPRYVKVDVEGAEWFVLRGMRATLAEHRPTVLLEVHPGWQPDGVRVEDVEGLLEQAGYARRVLQDQGEAVRQLWLPEA